LILPLHLVVSRSSVMQHQIVQAALFGLFPKESKQRQNNEEGQQTQGEAFIKFAFPLDSASVIISFSFHT
jgi:hypothetical protein